MSSSFDFHTHSKASDGALTPAELVRRASANGVSFLALTDHDTTAGLVEARKESERSGIQLIPGIELSVSWKGQCLHVVGLNIDPADSSLATGLESLNTVRQERAREIGRRLEKKRIFDAYEGAARLAGDGMITRTHFARHLVEQHHCDTMQQAFDHYLKRGKPGFVATEWVELQKGIEWIRGAGGIAVLAHPQRYKITATRMRQFLNNFRDSGGQALEVVCGSSTPDEIRKFARFGRQFGLQASSGSDFHTPESPWIEVGRLAALPEDIEPVWRSLGIDATAAPSH